MNSNPALNNILLASVNSPTANAAGKRPAADSNDRAVNDFQKTLQDVRAEQSRAEQSSIADKLDSRKARPVAKPEPRPLEKQTPVKQSARKTDELAQRSNEQVTAKKGAVAKTEKTDAKPRDADKETSNETEVTDSADVKASGEKKAVSDKKVSPKDDADESATNQTLTSDQVVLDTAAIPLTGIALNASSVEVDGGAVTTLDGDAINFSIQPDATSNVSTSNAITADTLIGEAELVASQLVSQSPVPAISDEAEIPVSLTSGSSAQPSANTATTAAAIVGLSKADATTLAGATSTTQAATMDGAIDIPSVDTSAVKEGEAATPVTDAKSAFEKMLHTMVSTSANTNTGEQSRDQSSSPQTNQTAGPVAAGGAAESLLRNLDTASPAARSFVVQTSVPVNVGQPSWSQAVGDKVLWLAAQNVSSAEIRLDPLDLGPMQVKVSVNQDQATVNFTSHHPVVREILDQNLNRLREMFSEQGLSLNVDVSDKSFSRHQGEGSEQKGQGSANKGVDDEEPVVAASTIMQQRLVDHYA